MLRPGRPLSAHPLPLRPATIDRSRPNPMPATHLLTCSCGRAAEVEPSQAGEQVTCECGARLDVPALRRLRELPRANDVDTSSAPPPAWGFRQGVLTAGLLAAAALAGAGAYVWAQQPPLPEGFDPQAREEFVDRSLEQMTPAEAYQHWTLNYREMRELAEMTDPRADAQRRQIQQMRLYSGSLWAAAGVVAVVTIIVYFAAGVGPRPR